MKQHATPSYRAATSLRRANFYFEGGMVWKQIYIVSITGYKNWLIIFPRKIRLKREGGRGGDKIEISRQCAQALQNILGHIVIKALRNSRFVNKRVHNLVSLSILHNNVYIMTSDKSAASISTPSFKVVILPIT